MTTNPDTLISKLRGMRASAFHFGGHEPTNEQFEEQVARPCREIEEAIRALAASAGEAAPGVPAFVKYEYRMRPMWLGEGEGWTPWQECAAGTVEDVRRSPVVNDWQYETRALCLAAPSAPAAPQVAAAPADLPMVDMVPPATSRDRWMYRQGWLAAHDPRSGDRAPEVSPPQPLPLNMAPKDGTLLRLLVKPDAESFTAFDDSQEPSWTVGFNNLDDTGEDCWQFAGWSWTHDCIIEGCGEPLGWLPMLDDSAAQAACTGGASHVSA